MKAPRATMTVGRSVDLDGGVRQFRGRAMRGAGERDSMTTQPFDRQYYEEGHLDEDRIALWWYARVLCRLRPQGGRLLDFGCGTGHLLKRLSAHFEAFGYDPATFARGRCRVNAPDAIVLEEWESIADASLDVVVSLHTLEHLPRPLPVVQALVAKLVAGGIFFFVVPNPGGLGCRLKGRQWFGYRDATHASLLGQGEWMMVVRKAGLEVTSVRGDGMWDAPYVRLLPTVVQRALFGAPAAAQLFWPVSRPFLPPVLGECLVITARRPA